MTPELQASIERLQIVVDDGGSVRHLANVDDLAALIADHARLEAVVEKLPRTADGVRIVPCRGTLVYHWQWVDDCGLMHGHPPIFYNGKWQIYGVPVSECYSTEQAAREAATGDAK